MHGKLQQNNQKIARLLKLEFNISKLNVSMIMTFLLLYKYSYINSTY